MASDGDQTLYSWWHWCTCMIYRTWEVHVRHIVTLFSQNFTVALGPTKAHQLPPAAIMMLPAKTSWAQASKRHNKEIFHQSFVARKHGWMHPVTEVTAGKSANRLLTDSPWDTAATCCPTCNATSLHTSGPKLFASSPVSARPQKTLKMLSHCQRFKRRLRFNQTSDYISYIGMLWR